jgi:hypothetical protein
VKLKFSRATADFDQQGWTSRWRLMAKPTTAGAFIRRSGQSHHAVFELEKPLTLKPGAKLDDLAEAVVGKIAPHRPLQALRDG